MTFCLLFIFLRSNVCNETKIEFRNRLGNHFPQQQEYEDQILLQDFPSIS